MTLWRVALNTPPVKTKISVCLWDLEPTFKSIGGIDDYRAFDVFDPLPFTCRGEDL
jgi:hypothetical protein